MSALQQALRDQEALLREQEQTLNDHESRIFDLEARLSELSKLSSDVEFALSVLASFAKGEDVDADTLSVAVEIAMMI